MGNPQILDFLKEIIGRIRTKSPKFFFIIMCVSVALTGASFLPDLLEKGFRVDISDYWVDTCKRIGIFFSGLFSGSILTVQSKTVSQTKEGQAITVIDEKKMPFTSKVQEKKIEETIPPPPVTDVPEAPEE
jgi:hypothetical protein